MQGWCFIRLFLSLSFFCELVQLEKFCHYAPAFKCEPVTVQRTRLNTVPVLNITLHVLAAGNMRRLDTISFSEKLFLIFCCQTVIRMFWQLQVTSGKCHHFLKGFFFFWFTNRRVNMCVWWIAAGQWSIFESLMKENPHHANWILYKLHFKISNCSTKSPASRFRPVFNDLHSDVRNLKPRGRKCWNKPTVYSLDGIAQVFLINQTTV